MQPLRSPQRCSRASWRFRESVRTAAQRPPALQVTLPSSSAADLLLNPPCLCVRDARVTQRACLAVVAEQGSTLTHHSGQKTIESVRHLNLAGSAERQQTFSSSRRCKGLAPVHPPCRVRGGRARPCNTASCAWCAARCRPCRARRGPG